jgi:hypothetical protein
MIYTAPYVMLLMRGQLHYEVQWEGLGPGNRDFLGPVKWHRAVRREPFGAQKSRFSSDPTMIRALVLFKIIFVAGRSSNEWWSHTLPSGALLQVPYCVVLYCFVLFGGQCSGSGSADP